MNPDADKLRNEVFGCEHCADLGAFTRSPLNHRFYKFPPIIGALGEADLLFVGINPRQDERNLNLHKWLMSAPDAFRQMSQNLDQDRRPYVALGAKENHYHCHMVVIEGVFGARTKFEEVAAVTELYLCANESGSALLDAGKSKCAERYLQRVIGIVKPQAVIAVGGKVQSQLTNYFGDIIKVPIVFMQHPWHLRGASMEEKRRCMQPTIEGVRRVLGLRGCCI